MMTLVRRDRRSFGAAEIPTMDRPVFSPLRPALSVLLGPIARPILYERLGRAEGRRILVRTWELYPAELAAVEGTARLGIDPALVMRLAASTIALRAAIMEAGTAHGTALEIAGELAWAVYRRMGRISWLLSGIVSRDPGQRLGLSTRIFRHFPFGPSAYVWESKPAPDGMVEGMSRSLLKLAKPAPLDRDVMRQRSAVQAQA
jgi:hypothetical protein